ncbi:MAG: DPP IV N-terminal domain-containing protein [Flavobacteriales bacterium]|nr:DPP IV N-terminal domain-containing protein [Flavobacteriales bacterium]
MLRNLLLVALATATLVSPAQEKLKELTLKDAITKAYSDYRPEHVEGLQWIPGTEQYSYVKDNTLVRGGTGRMADLPIVELEKLNTHFGKEAALKGIPDITWETADVFSFEHNDKIHVYTVSKATLSERMSLDAKAERTDMEATRHQVAFTLGEDLYMRSPASMENMRITSDGADGIANGRSVHREEYGITKGTFWSPTGEKLAFYRMDESMVTPYSLEDISTQPSTFKKIRYPMAGQTSHQVKLGVFDVASNRTTFMKTSGAPDDYLTNICWDPTGKYVFIIHLNRPTDKLRVVQYDASTGEAMKTVLEEEDKKWLEPQHPLTFLKRAPTTFIHWSQQDGFLHLYLYDTNKGLIRQLTKGAWVVKNIIGFDEKESVVFVEGTDVIDPKTPSGAMDTHIYRVELGSGKSMRLTKGSGTHSGQLGAGGRFIIDTWSSLSVPGRTEIIDAAKGTVLKTLVNSQDPLAQMKAGTVEFVRVLGENGDLLNGRLVKPKDFDSRRKYPVLVYVYNGPHVQLVTNSFLGGASLWMMYAAQRGYIVFTVDGHGSENRGRAFEQAVYRQLGVTETKDQLRGVDFLKSLPYVDTERMAVHGWSFGGHVTTALMLRSPGTFKVAVAGGPVMDWDLYEVMYTERYMDTPKENPEGYALTKHTDKADGLRGKLLVITGGMDDTVLPEHSYTFLKNAVEKNVQLDFFEYPGHGHNVRGKDRVHLYTKVLDYIDTGLGMNGR